MEQFDNIWGIILVAIPAVMGIVSLIVAATPTPRDDEIFGKISLILGRIFGVTKHKDAQGKSTFKLPVVQSSKPKDK